MASSSSTSPVIDQELEMDEESELIEYKAARSAIAKHLTLDPLTGQLESTDIIHYIDTHVNEPDVQRFFCICEKRNERKKRNRMQALANFDINTLRVIRGTSWAVSLEYAGLTTDKRKNDNWFLSKPKEEVETKGVVPQQQFQLYCYIREGPDTGGGSNSRYMDEFIGLPTSKQIEDFVKIAMACPTDCYEPSIPSILGFGHNLTPHETSLKPFLKSLPRGCRYVFEPTELKNRLSDQNYEAGKRGFREYMVHATRIKDAGNAAYARNHTAEAITQYAQAIEALEKLLLKSISEEEERELEARALIAVCWANSSAAKMLEVPGNRGETNLEGARLDAEKAITFDPTYAKGYIRLCHAQERLGNVSKAKDALVRGLRLKPLENHFGLADYLILLQTEKKGLPQSKDEFELWLKNVLVDDQESAERMRDLENGAWKTRCRLHGKSVGVDL